MQTVWFHSLVRKVQVPESEPFSDSLKTVSINTKRVCIEKLKIENNTKDKSIIGLIFDKRLIHRVNFFLKNTQKANHCFYTYKCIVSNRQVCVELA